MRTKTSITVLFLLLHFAANSQAASFTVEVTNRTRDVVLSDYPVKIEVMAKKDNWSFSPLLKTEGRTDGQGNFSGEIEAGVDTFLVARVYYRGIEYSSAMKPFSAKEEQYIFNVPVYEITSSGDGVSITSRKLQIEIINEQTLEVYDNLQVENSNGKTFVGAFNNELDLIDKGIAECIYAGMMTDTGSFRYPSTGKNVHLIIADLIIFLNII